MDTINDFINDTIFSDSNESRIGQYGNNVVNLINKFIRIVMKWGKMMPNIYNNFEIVKTIK